ncbi:MAG: hypothetical protein K2R93_18845 [Gemmatimonadaceae bacterium]|nr:hypothetical protein [Gemmatimonadaceae bacterium]
MSYEIIEQCLRAKTGRMEECEDTIVITPHFIAIGDGVTSKSDGLWGATRTSGRVAADLFAELLVDLPPTMAAHEAIVWLTHGFQQFYEKQGLLDVLERMPDKRPAITLAIYSVARREVWMLGDGLCRINGQVRMHEKAIDVALGAMRAVVLEQAIAEGCTIEELLRRDVGRETILPYLRKQSLLQNQMAETPFSYGVLDGFPVPRRFVEIHPVGDQPAELTLASDGYPTLEASLEATEELLRSLLDTDPLCFRALRSTKGMRPECEAHDDRAYIRFRV